MKFLRMVLFAFLWTQLPGSLSAVEKHSETIVLAVAAPSSYNTKLGQLQYAPFDAKRFTDIMVNVGYVPENHVVLLENGSIGDLLGAFETVKTSLKMDTCKEFCGRKFIFYYSGHADENGLHLRDGLLSKNELHELLSSVTADTKVAILDSCFSGALVRKGIEPAPLFELPKAEFDEPSGSVFLSASSEKEFAYESVELKGGLFTHHLIAGLSGAADTSNDGIVTIDELYQYIYRETKLYGLLFPSKNAQTPEFVSHLEGRGAIALSFPAETSSKLLLESDIAGQISLASKNGIRLFHADKPLGVKKTLQIPPGQYTVTVNQGHRVGKGDIELQPKRYAMLKGKALEWQDYTMPVMKKGVAGGGDSQTLKVFLGRQGGLAKNQTPGPRLEIGLGRDLVQLGPFWLSVSGSLGYYDLIMRDGNDWASTQGLTLLGTPIAYYLVRGENIIQKLGLLAGMGGAFQVQKWHYADTLQSFYVTQQGYYEGPQETSKTLKASLPMLSFGAFYDARWGDQNLWWGLEVRREILFAHDLDAGSRTLYANVIGLNIKYEKE